MRGGEVQRGVSIQAGYGDDRVYVEPDGAALVPMIVDLGPGADLYEGSAADDYVTEDYEGIGFEDGNGSDVIRTYGGDDRVVTGGLDGPAQTDDIDLGSGDDELSAYLTRGTTPASRLEGGPGVDRIDFWVDGGAITLDLARRQVQVGSRVAHRGWTGFEGPYELEEALYVLDVAPPSSFTVRGSARPEQVGLGYFRNHVESSAAGPLPVQVALGGGEDRFVSSWRMRGRLDGGDGRDDLVLSAPDVYGARLDLLRERFTFTGQRWPLEVRRFQDASLFISTNRRVTLIGNQYQNRLTAPCGLIRGGPGDDVIVSGVSGGSRCTSVTFYGDKGDDRISGTRTDDLLDGGPGRDVVDGLQGTDECRAEVRRNCER